MFFVFFTFGIISIVFLIRDILVLLGVYKDPILILFQRYGNHEPVYYPFPALLFWLGLLVISVGWVIQSITTIHVPSLEISFLLWFLAYLAHQFQQPSQDAMPVLPSWYRQLMQETSRVERRRIAYMWLRLPLRTRLLYSASNHQFFLWADLVIIATIEEA
ncbi:MAG: hypothetical protein Kow00117_07250 [Phototrophicales bacterium]